MTQQQFVEATPEQIAAFKMGAADRYKARGVKPAAADQLFNAHLEKMAAEMGIGVEPPSPKVQKIAAQLKKLVAASRKA